MVQSAEKAPWPGFVWLTEPPLPVLPVYWSLIQSGQAIGGRIRSTRGVLELGVTFGDQPAAVALAYFRRDITRTQALKMGLIRRKCISTPAMPVEVTEGAVQ